MALAPTDPKPRLWLAQAYQDLDRPEDAKEQLLAILRQDPNHVPAQVRLAWVHWELGADEQAIAAGRWAVAFAPGDRDAHYMLALARNSGLPEAAIVELQWVLQHAPDDDEASEALAAFLDALGRHDEAAKAREKSELQLDQPRWGRSRPLGVQAPRP